MWQIITLWLAAVASAPTNTPAPPYASVLARQPYGVTLRLLLAPDQAALREIQLDHGNAQGVSWLMKETDNAQVRIVQIFAPSSQKLSLRFRVRNDYRDSAWSQPISVTTRPAFSKAPSEPSDFAVTAASPFAFALSWRDTAQREHSFEIERCDCGPCQRIALALPNSTSRRIGGFLPKSGASFRIRAVNSAGHSPWSAVRTVQTPALTQKLVPISKPQLDSRQPDECITLAALKQQVAQDNRDAIKFTDADPITLQLTQLGPAHPTVTVSNSNDCGTAGCEFSVYSETNGCLRTINFGFREALDLGDDWPILVARWHSNASLFGNIYSQMIEGRYQDVDYAVIIEGVESTLPSAEAELERAIDSASCHKPVVKEVSTERAK